MLTKQYGSVQDRLNLVQNIVNGQSFDIDNFNELYKVSSSNNLSIKHGSPWFGNSDEIVKRIRCDIDGTKYTRNGITYTGKKLNQYKDKKFKEKFLEIQTSGETIIETDDENNVEYSLETIKGNKKLEIVYIMQ